MKSLSIFVLILTSCVSSWADFSLTTHRMMTESYKVKTYNKHSSVVYWKINNRVIFKGLISSQVAKAVERDLMRVTEKVSLSHSIRSCRNLSVVSHKSKRKKICLERLSEKRSRQMAQVIESLMTVTRQTL